MYEHKRPYPNHCEACDGTGYVGGFAGSYLEPPEDPEPCMDCLASGVCPICGRTFETDPEALEGFLESGEQFVCKTCVWTTTSGEWKPYVGVDLDVVERTPFVPPSSWIRIGTLPGTTVPIFAVPMRKDIRKDGQP